MKSRALTSVLLLLLPTIACGQEKTINVRIVSPDLARSIDHNRAVSNYLDMLRTKTPEQMKAEADRRASIIRAWEIMKERIAIDREVKLLKKLQLWELEKAYRETPEYREATAATKFNIAMSFVESSKKDTTQSTSSSIPQSERIQLRESAKIL